MGARLTCSGSEATPNAGVSHIKTIMRSTHGMAIFTLLRIDIISPFYITMYTLASKCRVIYIVGVR
jgi:hypothetical protein